jgi:hypothetical protein
MSSIRRTTVIVEEIVDPPLAFDPITDAKGKQTGKRFNFAQTIHAARRAMTKPVSKEITYEFHVDDEPEPGCKVYTHVDKEL